VGYVRDVGGVSDECALRRAINKSSRFARSLQTSKPASRRQESRSYSPLRLSLHVRGFRKGNMGNLGSHSGLQLKQLFLCSYVLHLPTPSLFCKEAIACPGLSNGDRLANHGLILITGRAPERPPHTPLNCKRNVHE